MQYAAKIEFDDHVDAQNACDPLIRLKLTIYGFFYLCVGLLVTYTLFRMLATGIEVWRQGRVVEVVDTLGSVGKGHLPWIGIILVPFAIYFIRKTFGVAYHLIVPLRWQPFARHRLIRKGYLGPHVYTFSPHQIVSRDRAGETQQTSWAKFRGFKETDRGFYLICAETGVPDYLLPKNGCRNEKAVAALRSQLSGHLPRL